jgi:hypothetical protein
MISSFVSRSQRLPKKGTRSLLKKSAKALYRQVGDLPHNRRPITYMQEKFSASYC